MLITKYESHRPFAVRVVERAGLKPSHSGITQLLAHGRGQPRQHRLEREPGPHHALARPECMNNKS
jgi:hypothetical protein